MSLATLESAVNTDISVFGRTSRPNLIHWRYTDPISLKVNPLFEALVDNIGFDLTAYARFRYGPSATAYLATPDIYGWRIKYVAGGQNQVKGIDMLDVANWKGRKIFGLRMKNWGCYFRSLSPYTWRGCYIIRI